MHKPVVILSPYRNKKWGYLEQGAMALLFVVGMVQIVCAFGASSGMVAGDSAKVADVHHVSGKMLAKR